MNPHLLGSTCRSPFENSFDLIPYYKMNKITVCKLEPCSHQEHSIHWHDCSLLFRLIKSSFLQYLVIHGPQSFCQDEDCIQWKCFLHFCFHYRYKQNIEDITQRVLYKKTTLLSQSARCSPCGGRDLSCLLLLNHVTPLSCKLLFCSYKFFNQIITISLI